MHAPSDAETGPQGTSQASMRAMPMVATGERPLWPPGGSPLGPTATHCRLTEKRMASAELLSTVTG